MNIKVRLSIAVILLWVIAVKVYGFFQGPIESSAGVNQLDDKAVSFSVAMHVSQGDMVGWIAVLAVVFLVLIWVPPMPHHKKEEK